jgi:hypothetical protein
MDDGEVLGIIFTFYRRQRYPQGNCNLLKCKEWNKKGWTYLRRKFSHARILPYVLDHWSYVFKFIKAIKRAWCKLNILIASISVAAFLLCKVTWMWKGSEMIEVCTINNEIWYDQCFIKDTAFILTKISRKNDYYLLQIVSSQTLRF